MPDRVIDDDDQLEEALAPFLSMERLTLDTEFLWERTYYPTLALVQIGGRDAEGRTHAVAIDPLAVDSAPVLELLRAPSRLKVLHAGRIDLQIFHRLIGEPLAPVFDTQTAAALAGHGAQVGYANLVEALLGTRLAKTEQYADWTRRPLTAAQVDYALGDVIPLLDVHDKLLEVLDASGRLEWVAEESAALIDPATYVEESPAELYTKIKGRKSLDRRGLAVLRELAAWRDEEARERDLRPGFVVRDQSLVELAARKPTDDKGLARIRGLHPGERRRSGKAILAAIRRGEHSDDLPSKQRRTQKRDVKAATDLLKAFLSQRAGEVGVAPEVLSTSSALERLARDAERERYAADHPLLQGWRRALVGDDVLRLLRGEVSLGLDPSSAALRLEPHEE